MIHGLYAYAATAIVAGALAFGAGWRTQEWRYGKQIAGIRAQYAELVASSAKSALKLTEWGRTGHFSEHILEAKK